MTRFLKDVNALGEVQERGVRVYSPNNPPPNDVDAIVDPTDSAVIIVETGDGPLTPTPAYAPTGGVMQFAGATAPEGWLICDGTYIDKVVYAALYAVVGDAYLAGAATIAGKFRLPDLRQNVPMGAQADVYPVGTYGGERNHTLTEAELPGFAVVYVPTVTTAYGTNIIGSPTNGYAAKAHAPGSYPAPSSFTNLQPYLAINFIIKT